MNGGNIRTLHRNLLLPLGVKLEPDYKSDDSILEEDYSSSDESEAEINSKTKVDGKEKAAIQSSEDKSHLEKEKNKPQSREEFESQIEISPDSDIYFEPDTVISPDTKVMETATSLEESVEKRVVEESKEDDSHPNVEDSNDKIIPEDVSLTSQFLLPNIYDSSSDEETEITELQTEAETNVTNNEEEMPSINSEASSLVNTNEFLD